VSFPVLFAWFTMARGEVVRHARDNWVRNGALTRWWNGEWVAPDNRGSDLRFPWPNAGRETLRTLIETKLDNSIVRQADESKILREELGGNFQRLGARVSESLTEASGVQKERLENVTNALGELSGKLEKAQEGLRSAVELGLDKLRTDNAEKLEQMRITVDEKLQGTLEQRLDASFKAGEHSARASVSRRRRDADSGHRCRRFLIDRLTVVKAACGL
jgi:hypothetical protein